MGDKNSSLNLFNSNKDKFKTKRQASKYLNHYGKIWKIEHNIDLLEPKRGK